MARMIMTEAVVTFSLTIPARINLLYDEPVRNTAIVKVLSCPSNALPSMTRPPDADAETRTSA